MDTRACLPDTWVAAIFAKLTVRYGRAFVARWEGIDERLVRRDWAEQLAGFERRADCLAYGLDNLPPERPPTVGQFRELCNAKPEERQVLRLDAPRCPIPPSLAEALQRIKEPQEVQSVYAGPKGWARRLRDRDRAGERLSPIQRRLWRDALEERSVGSAARYSSKQHELDPRGP